MPTTSTAPAAAPKMLSVRCSRRACCSDSGGLNSATSTASAETVANAATWWRNAIRADEYKHALPAVRNAQRGSPRYHPVDSPDDTTPGDPHHQPRHAGHQQVDPDERADGPH